MHFTKMQGAGNDYVYVNGFCEKISDAKRLSIRISDRHFGAGSDGLIIITGSDNADIRMKMYNSDGSVGGMCGNGIRCAALFAKREGLIEKDYALIETDAGIKEIFFDDNKASVNMGEAKIVNIPLPDITHIPGALYAVSVDMGNPHFVIIADRDTKDYAALYGEKLENAAEFPGGTNVEFIFVADREHITMSVWERGSKLTLSCGTGSCAGFIAARLKGLVDKHVYVKNPGGILEIYEKDKNLFLSGPAVFVYDGDFYP